MMKKLFSNKKIPDRKRLVEFLDRKGFYVVLILCIAVVVVAALYVSNRNISLSNKGLASEETPFELDEEPFAALLPEEESGPASGVTQSEGVAQVEEDAALKQSAEAPMQEAASDGSGDGISTAIAKVQPEKATVIHPDEVAVQPDQGLNKSLGKEPSNKNEVTDKNNPVKPKETAPKEQSFIRPVLGAVTFEYAMDRLVYSKTLEEWRTHSGIDIASDRGTNVKCVAEGVVSEVKNDPRYGITIIVEHDNKIKSVYSNLASEDTVTPNQKVKQGDIIGSIGNTAVFEAAEQTHLHFEMWKDNVPQDPAIYIQELKSK